MSVYGDKEILMKYAKIMSPRFTPNIPGEYQLGWHAVVQVLRGRQLKKAALIFAARFIL